MRWGDFVVTGTYDIAAESFTVTAVTPGDEHVRPDEEGDLYTSPCAEPPGGWRVLDEARTTETAKDAAVARAAALEDPAAAEATIREVWGGMLCVSRAERTEAELQRIAQEISSGDAGVIANVDAMSGEIIVCVTYDDGSLQRRFDGEHGDGLVSVTSVLQPAG